MAWREAILTRVGPSILSGVTLGDWMRLLWRERFGVSPWCLPRAAAITAQGASNSIWGLIERWRFGARVEAAPIPPPIFVLGHWRSGTTHLHNLLCADERFAFPNNYQVSFPHTFLSTEALCSKMVAFFLPARRPMDNVEWSVASPQEDEFALCSSSLVSPCLAWVFPARRERYQRYLTLRDATPGEIERWSKAFRWFLRKLSFKYGRPLVLKSPTHTARVALLAQLFPGARFLHIRRHPHAVYQSTRWMSTVTLDWHRLQRRSLDELDDWLIRQYREMYDAYFEERQRLPPGSLHEMSFEELEADPIGQLRAAYGALGLPDFEAVRPRLEKYLASLAGYRKNTFPPLEEPVRARLAREWRRAFEEWGYAGGEG